LIINTKVFISIKMKKLLPFILILGFIFPIHPAYAISCPTAKKIQKEMEKKGFDMESAEGVTRTLAYYELIITNPKCFNCFPRIYLTYVLSVKIHLSECKNQIMMKHVQEKRYGIAIWKQFCTGMKKLEKYTK